jgi:predicted RNase H-like nuclease (RuvC/YqgF family)
MKRYTFTIHGMVENSTGAWIDDKDLQPTLDEKDKRIEELEAELETHSWEISPAMAQAKIDQLQAENSRLKKELLYLVTGEAEG